MNSDDLRGPDPLDPQHACPTVTARDMRRLLADYIPSGGKFAVRALAGGRFELTVPPAIIDYGHDLEWLARLAYAGPAHVEHVSMHGPGARWIVVIAPDNPPSESDQH